jgi:hypothetical protein
MTLEYSTGITGSDQDRYFETGHTYRQVPIRVKVRVNSYEHQSTAVAQVWSQKDLRWNEIASARPETWWVSPYSDLDTLREAIDEVHDELVTRAHVTLG